MIALACRKSAGTLTSSCGTKNDRIMNSPIRAVTSSGSSRFMVSGSLRRHPLRERVEAERFEDAAQHDGQQDRDLRQVGALEAAHQPGVARQVGARGVQLLANQG